MQTLLKAPISRALGHGSRQSGGTPPLGEVYAPSQGGGGVPHGGRGNLFKIGPGGRRGVPRPRFTYSML
jgi:hypothetical protein